MNYRKISFVVIFVLAALPGFSQSVLLEGIARTGAKAAAEQTVASALTNKIIRVVAPLTTAKVISLPAFSASSFNASTLDLSNLLNGRGNAFISYHAKFLKNLGINATFEGFFLPSVEALQKELVAPMSNPTHASQALYNAAFNSLKFPSGFFGVKVMQQDGAADVLVLDVHTGEWQSLQKFLGGVQLPAEPLTK